MTTPEHPKQRGKRKKKGQLSSPQVVIDKSKPPHEIIDSNFDSSKGLLYKVQWTKDTASVQWEPKETVLIFKELLQEFHQENPNRPRFVEVDVDRKLRPDRISDSRLMKDGGLQYYAWWTVLIDQNTHVRGYWVPKSDLDHCSDMTAAFHRKYPSRAPGELCYTCLGLDCGFQELLLLKDPEADGPYQTSGADGFSDGTNVMSMSFGIYGHDLLRSVQETACGGCSLLLEGVKAFRQPWMNFDDANFQLELILSDGQALTGFVIPKNESDISKSTSMLVALQFYVMPGDYCPWPSIGPKIGTKISLYESPMAYGIARHISRTPNDDSTFELIQHWYETCKGSHKTCIVSKNASMPSRLICISEDSGKVFVQETNGSTFDYVALSHCWGLSLHLRAMVDTIEDMKSHIPWDSLPKTYQDAIIVGKRLGIDYIWIDSLCILQDSVHDWEVESAKMGQVYQNAVLVVAASSGVDGDQGCFRDRSYSHELRPVHVGTAYTVWVRELLDHSYFGLGLSDNFKSARRDRSVELNPLFQRAWTLQERYLATRSIHFTDSEMVWECQEGASCECGAIYNFSGDRLLEFLREVKQGRAIDTPDSIRETWRDLIPVYSQRSLTKQTDALPALSGLAEAFISASEDRYLAGLWLKDLHRSLLWYSVENSNERRKDYTGPSWSWCCIRGPIEIIRPLSGGVEQLSDFVSAECIVNGANPFGQVSSAALVIRGVLHVAALEAILWGSPTRYQGQTAVWLSTSPATPDFRCLATVDDEADAKSWEVGKGLALFVILLDKASGGGGWLRRALLLEQHGDDTNSNIYRRIGLVIQGTQEAWDWERGDVQEITIV